MSSPQINIIDVSGSDSSSGHLKSQGCSERQHPQIHLYIHLYVYHVIIRKQGLAENWGDFAESLSGLRGKGTPLVATPPPPTAPHPTPPSQGTLHLRLQIVDHDHMYHGPQSTRGSLYSFHLNFMVPRCKT